MLEIQGENTELTNPARPTSFRSRWAHRETESIDGEVAAVKNLGRSYGSDLDALWELFFL